MHLPFLLACEHTGDNSVLGAVHHSSHVQALFDGQQSYGSAPFSLKPPQNINALRQAEQFA